MLLPLGEAGVKAIGSEQIVLAALKDNVKEPGFYIFPAPDRTPGMSKEQQHEAERKLQEMWRTGPSGITIFHPQGIGVTFPQQLATQFGADILTMLLAAILLSWVTGTIGYAGRVLFIALLGLFPTLAVEVPLWNWYGFPTVYTLAQFTIHLVGFVVGGLAVAALVRTATPSSAGLSV
jgi:hypothetical protein